MMRDNSITRRWKQCVRCGAQCSGRRRPGGCCARSRYQSFYHLWLAGAVSTGGMGSVESQAAVRTSAETRWEEAAVDLQHGDPKEPVAAQVPICIVDAGDGGRSDQGQVQHLTEPGLGGAAFGAALLSCPKCDRNDDPSAYARRRRSRLLPAAQAL